MNLRALASRLFTLRKILVVGVVGTIALVTLVLARFYISDDVRVLGGLQRALGWNREAYNGELAKKVAAHRGYGGPENTIKSIQSAIDKGATMIEVDVRWCKDGWILFHDETAKSLANSSGGELIANMDLEAIRKLQGSVEFENERIVFFETALSEFQSNNIVWLVDIKDTGSTDELLSILRKFDVREGQSKFLLLARYEVIEQYKDSGFPLGYCAGFSKEWNAAKFLFGHSFILKNSEALGQDLQCVVLPSPFLRTELIADAHSRGLEVWGYSVRKEWDDAKEHQAWLAKGVDGLIVDDLPAGLELLGGQ